MREKGYVSFFRKIFLYMTFFSVTKTISESEVIRELIQLETGISFIPKVKLLVIVQEFPEIFNSDIFKLSSISLNIYKELPIIESILNVSVSNLPFVSTLENILSWYDVDQVWNPTIETVVKTSSNAIAAIGEIAFFLEKNLNEFEFGFLKILFSKRTIFSKLSFLSFE